MDYGLPRIRRVSSEMLRIAPRLLCVLAIALAGSARAATGASTQSETPSTRIGAVGSHHGRLAWTWYGRMMFSDDPPAFAGLGCPRLPDEGDRSITDDEKPRIVEYYRAKSVDLVKRGDIVWLTGHGKKNSLRYFGRSLFELQDLKDSRCSWLVLSACSLIDAKSQSGTRSSNGTVLEGSGIQWLLSSRHLHGVLGYNGGAAWFGAKRRENELVGKTFADQLLIGTPVPRAWMLANQAAANAFHENDRSKQFNALNATAICWSAFENEKPNAIDREHPAPEGGEVVFMSLRQDRSGDGSSWEIHSVRGRARRSTGAAPDDPPTRMRKIR